MPQKIVQMVLSPVMCLADVMSRSWWHHRQLACMFSQVLHIHLCHFCAGGAPYKVQRPICWLPFKALRFQTKSRCKLCS